MFHNFGFQITINGIIINSPSETPFKKSAVKLSFCPDFLNIHRPLHPVHPVILSKKLSLLPILPASPKLSCEGGSILLSCQKLSFFPLPFSATTEKLAENPNNSNRRIDRQKRLVRSAEPFTPIKNSRSSNQRQ